MNSNIFVEKQNYRKWWVILLIILANSVYIYFLFKIDFIGDLKKEKLGLVFSWSIFILVSLLFYFIKLETKYDEKGIHYKMTPFHFKYKFIAWEDIQTYEIKKYNPLLDYGGWGIKQSMTGKGIAYNIVGNLGLYLILKDNQKILIGTQKAEELKSFLKTKIH
ncbi:MAG: hypothetical protein RLZZ175_183 [Bacteroidota bacterium]|jgi:hypothetical protein